MTFGEKLFKLRKGKGLSQEALAEQLNTSRQAISKWENDQGYPETEKLLMIGNIFEVSTDYLLKDTVELSDDHDEGYYVSKEMAEAYLLSVKRAAKYVAFGFFLITLAFVPYFLFKDDPIIYTFLIIITVTVGFGVLVSAGENHYKILKQEPLLFDEKYLKELGVKYDHLKKRYTPVMIVGVCLFIAGLLSLRIEDTFLDTNVLEPYYPIAIVIFGIGFAIIIRTSMIIDAYKLLAKNEEYTNGFFFKLRRKVRRRVDEF